MTVYIFANVEHLTRHTFHRGGAVAVAPTLEHARRLIEAAGADGGGIQSAEPTAEYAVSNDAPIAGWCFADMGAGL